jgi:hypothetical protein
MVPFPLSLLASLPTRADLLAAESRASSATEFGFAAVSFHYVDFCKHL